MSDFWDARYGVCSLHISNCYVSYGSMRELDSCVFFFPFLSFLLPREDGIFSDSVWFAMCTAWSFLSLRCWLSNAISSMSPGFRSRIENERESRPLEPRLACSSRRYARNTRWVYQNQPSSDTPYTQLTRIRSNIGSPHRSPLNTPIRI